MNTSILIFDGTSYFIEDEDYQLGWEEKIVFRGSYLMCLQRCQELTEGL